MRISRFPRPNECRAFSVKPLLLTNKLRVQAAFCSIFPWKMCRSSACVGSLCHLTSNRNWRCSLLRDASSYATLNTTYEVKKMSRGI